ncbi:hypothetical protein [Bacillus thuringiensis]|uniref:hypothetical protein n=1 Tax=Bacillus thuringiensis TaxID=1428 RepID=UPI0018F8826D|nr:hypothetical protein [Bacillus thuringiensis]MBG9536381.1 hypothetical protein [Bacillus thuringiensis]
MENRVYKNEDGKVVSGGVADQHFLKKHIENDSLLTFIQDKARQEFKDQYIKTKTDLIELGEMLKMYYQVLKSGEEIIFNIDALDFNYRIGDDIYNPVVLRVW